MPANALLLRLVDIYRGENIRYPQLRAVTLAQWMVESGRATSRLAKDHYNFGGLKWRKEMTPYATKVAYEAHDGPDNYCKFATIESFINGYWAFLNRAPYSGWEEHTESAEDFIGFIGPIYTPSNKYVAKVLALLPEAEALLAGSETTFLDLVETAESVDLGTIVLDPGHGGAKNLPGSSQNNAVSFSGVKEKKLTLDFCFILRDELLKQCKAAGEIIKVVLTRSTDVNVAGADRAGKAFSSKAKVFLSLHFNGDKSPSVSGAETYYRAEENDNLNLEADIAFAEAVQAGLLKGLRSVDSATKDRGIKPDTKTQIGALGVLNDANLGNNKVERMCVSALTEIEFITNKRVDVALVSGPDAVANRTKVMAAVAKALRAHMKANP